MSEHLKPYNKSTSESLVFKDGEPYIRRINTTFYINTLTQQRTWRDSEPEFIPLLEAKPELRKEISYSIIIRRQMLGTFELTPTYSYFEQAMKIRIPNEPKYKYIYLTKNKDILGQIIMLQDLTRSSQILSPNNELVERIGKPKQLTDEQFEELRKEGIPIYSERRELSNKYGSIFEKWL